MFTRRTAAVRSVLATAVVVGAIAVPPLTSSAATHRSNLPVSKGGWSEVGPMSARRAGDSLIVRLADGRVLVAGGSTRRDIGCKRSADLFDPRTGSWTETESMRRDRCRAVAALLPDGRVLVAGGFGVRWEGPACACIIARRSTEIYDPRSGTWSAGLPMRERRGGPMATRLPDGTVVVAGGSNRHLRPRTTVEIYHPRSQRWTRAPSMRTPHSSMLRIDGRTLLVTGDPRESADRKTSAERYLVHRGVWRRAGSFHLPAPSPVGPQLARLPSGDAIAVSGRSAHRYDAASHHWRRMPSLPPRLGSVTPWSQRAVQLHRRPLLLSAHVEYDRQRCFGVGHQWSPHEHRWVRVTTMPRPLDDFLAQTLSPRQVLVAGGVARYRSAEGGDHIPTRYAVVYAR